MFTDLRVTMVGILILLGGGMCTVFIVMMHPLFVYNPADVPPITASPMKASDIYSVSQFRSNNGHDYSVDAWDGESCRSMKHYINSNMNVDENNIPVRSAPKPDHPNIAIYAPQDGTITSVKPENTPIGMQIHIASRQNPSFFVVLFHTDLLPTLHVGSTVTSGQQIGTVGPMDGIDVAYEARTITFRVVYLSIFEHMTQSAFAPFAAMGYKPDSFVLTRAQADASGYQCSGEQFTNAPISSPGAPREGVVSLRPNPWIGQYNRIHNIGQ